jgi:methionyl-tRNA formyltransferase
MQSLIFFGADQYSAVALNAIIESKKCEIVAVITDRGKPKGKEQIIEVSPVEKLAKAHNLKVFYYPDFNHDLITKDTLGLCASFDHLIPTEIINLFSGNLYNLHPSLLPQYRNVSPVQYALAMGDTQTGITLFRITPTIDNGEIIAQTEEEIKDDDTTQTLTPRLFAQGAKLFLNYIANPTQRPAHHSEAHKSEGWIFTRRLTRDSGYIEWPVLQNMLNGKMIEEFGTKNELFRLRLTHNPSSAQNMLYDVFRALYPWPGIWSLVPTIKGEQRISLESLKPEIKLKIAGKPNPITYKDFEKYYL